MNTIAFVVALAAVVLFLVAAFSGHAPDAHPVRRWNWIALGLAALTIAWILQLVLASGGKVTLS